jgi:hypothetical protein
MIPLWKGEILFILRSLGQGHRYYKYNFWQQGRFHMITLVLYIGSLPNLTTWFPVEGEEPYIFWGHYVKGQGHCYYKYNFWQQGRFCTITLVLYIGSLTNLATWFPCGRGRTLFILGSLPLYRLIICIDGCILWCTHFLFTNVTVYFAYSWQNGNILLSLGRKSKTLLHLYKQLFGRI